MLDSLPNTKPKNLADLYPKASPEALDLLKKLLQFNPSKRLTAEQALEHPYVAKFHDPANEPACEAPLKIMVDDNEKRSVSEYRDLLYAEILKRKRDVR